MAKVNREFIPAVVKEVSPAQEVFHLELSASEMAFLFLLVGNSCGQSRHSSCLYGSLKTALNFDETLRQLCKLNPPFDRIEVQDEDIDAVLSKRQK